MRSMNAPVWALKRRPALLMALLTTKRLASARGGATAATRAMAATARSVCAPANSARDRGRRRVLKRAPFYRRAGWIRAVFPVHAEGGGLLTALSDRRLRF